MKIFIERQRRGTPDQAPEPVGPAGPRPRRDDATQPPRDLKAMLEHPEACAQRARDRSQQAHDGLARMEAARILHGHILGISR